MMKRSILLLLLLAIALPQSVLGWYRTPATNGKYGYMESSERNKTGSTRWKIAPIFEDCAYAIYEGGIAAAKKDGKWGFINDKGTFVIPAIFDQVPVTNISSYRYSRGNLLIAVCYNGGWGAIDLSGRFVILPCYEKIGFGITSRIEGRPLLVYREGVVQYVLDTGEPILVTECPEGGEAECFGKNGERETMLFPVKKEGKWGYVNAAGEWMIDPRLEAPGNWQSNTAIVEQDGKFGVINCMFDTLIPVEYDKIDRRSSSYGGYFVVSRNGRYGALALNGKVIVPVKKKSADKVTYKQCNKIMGSQSELHKAISDSLEMCRQQLATILRSLYEGISHSDSLNRAQLCYLRAKEFADATSAAYWHNRAAWLGNTSAQNTLGALLYNGTITPSPEYGQAFRWFEKAAEGGSKTAIENLGLCCYTGRGTDRDYQKAIEYYALAMVYSPDSKEILRQLGNCYYSIGTLGACLAAKAFYEKAEDSKGVERSLEEIEKLQERQMQKFKTFTVQHKDITITREIADNFNRGLDYVASGDYTVAYHCFKRAAELGLTKAEEQIAYMYINNYEGFTDLQGRLYWCKRFARNTGYPPIFTYIGNIYFEQENYPEMLRWILPAADVNEGEALFRMGYCYHYGTGVEVDHAKAEAYYLKAAAQGIPEAKGNLAILYDDMGRLEDALKWSAEAADEGNMSAMGNYAGYALKTEPSPQHYRQALCYLLASAISGDANGQYNLAFLYSDDNRTWNESPNYDAARFWLTKAAENGDAPAMYLLGMVYENEWWETEPDYTKAIHWYRRAVEMGFIQAYNALGMCYHSGHGVENDDAEALRWVSMGARYGDPNAMLSMAIFNYFGTDAVPENLEQAREWFARAQATGADLGMKGALVAGLLGFSEDETDE